MRLGLSGIEKSVTERQIYFPKLSATLELIKLTLLFLAFGNNKPTA